MWLFSTVYIIISIILWSGFDGYLVMAAPLRRTSNQTNLLFPQQKWVPPQEIKDGQSFMNKLFIMKMINYLEYKTVQQMGIYKPIPYIREYIYEGDIILTRKQVLSFVHPEGSQRRRRRRKRKMDVHVLGDSHVKKWELPIEYVIDSSHTSCSEETIRSAIQHWEEQTCITFRENNNASGTFLNFTKGSGCYSRVGKNDNLKDNPIFISDSCCTKGIIAHEIGHALGFWHEHAREDRDNYVKTNTSNMIPGQEYNFQKISWAEIDNQEVPYDISSVMHYNAVTFSMQKDSLTTLETHNSFLQNSMGQRLGLSFYDVKLANKAYCNNCCDPNSLQGSCLHDGYQDPNNCSRCRCTEGLSGDLCDTVTPSTDGCGGVINLSDYKQGNISSPGFSLNTTYEPGISCFWLLQSPEGTIIKMKFLENMNSNYCTSDLSEYSPCVDFVEIRVDDNLGSTGGRFCCNNTFQRDRLTDFIYSHNNHSLILFKTTEYGHGFQLQYSYESCGGCYSDDGEEQRPCYSHVTRICYQTWTTNENVTINSSNTAETKPSYRIQKVEKQRQSTCPIEEPYCCSGYVLTKDNESCIVSSLATTQDNAPKEISTVVITTNDHVTKNSSDTEGDDSMTGWSEWSSWSECGEPQCGGCCNQTRTRTYYNDTNNGETESDSQMNLDACKTGSKVRQCATIITTTCGSFMYQYDCEKTEYYSQAMKCCCGYYLPSANDTICVEGRP